MAGTMVDLNEGPKPKGPDDVLTFGRWKGYKVSDVAKDDPGYLVWAHLNVEFFKLDEDYLIGVEEAAQEAADQKKTRKAPMRITPHNRDRLGRARNVDQDTVDRFNEQNRQRGRFGDDGDDEVPF